MVAVTAAELSDGDRERLNGGVLRVLQKGSCGREELLAGLHERLATYRSVGAA